VDLFDELARFRAERPPRTRTVAGVEWRYLAAGSGSDALLLLPGYFVGAESWFRVVPLLAPFGRVIAPDYPRVRTVRDLAHGLERVLEAERIESLTIVGQSVGGAYARALAPILEPTVRALVLSHAALPGSGEAERVRRGNRLGRLAPAWLHRRQWRRRIAAERAGSDPATRFWRTILLERAAHLTRPDVVAWGACYLDLLERPDDPASRAWSGPVLVIESDDDPVIDAAARRALREHFEGAHVTTFSGTGHWTPELDPVGFGGALSAFLAS
jgi:pimeloyl-ACP methyl ester carboxylesterase